MRKEVQIEIVAIADKYIPQYAHENDVGCDLVACIWEQSVTSSALATQADSPLKAVVIRPGECRLIKTGIQIKVPKGWEAQVRSRSGLALKSQVHVLNSPGTIDPDYTGPVGVILQNSGSCDFQVEDGMRIAQLVVKRAPVARWKRVEALTEEGRGANGYGSTSV